MSRSRAGKPGTEREAECSVVTTSGIIETLRALPTAEHFDDEEFNERHRSLRLCC